MRTENIREVSLKEIADLPVHPVADIFPMLAENSSDRDNGKADKQTITLAELSDSIVENGLQEPIVLYTTTDSQGDEITWLLDGRNRRAACILGKIETVQVENFIGSEEEAETYILNLNIDRRDLTPGQRAFAAAKYWEMVDGRHGGDRKTDQAVNSDGLKGDNRQILATRFRVSNSYVNQAHKELDAITTARIKAEELQAQAEEFDRIEKEAEAKLELAKAEGKLEIVKEAATVINEAANNKTNLRERAAAAAETASTKERRASRVQRGETMNSVYGETKKKEESDDPIGKLRVRITSTVTNLKQSISELAAVSGQGEEEFNFLGRKITDIVDHYDAEFGVSNVN